MDNERNKRDLVGHEVDRTMSSLDNLPDIESDQYFYARLKQRLGSQTTTEGWLTRLLTTYRLAPISLAVIVLANVVTMAVALRDSGTGEDYREQYVEAFADQYSLSTSDVVYEYISE